MINSPAVLRLLEMQRSIERIELFAITEKFNKFKFSGVFDSVKCQRVRSLFNNAGHKILIQF